MDEQQLPQVSGNEPPAVPPQGAAAPATPPAASAAAPAPQPSLSSLTGAPNVTQKPKRVNPLYIVIGAVLCTAILVFGFLYARSTAPATEAPPAAVRPTEVPTPTPPPNVSRIATTSAFMVFKEEIASFSATLNAFTLQDSTLAPPILDLELNLAN